MIEHLATLIENFPGAANQTRCFTHILNLVAKSILRQFEAPKSKGNVLDDAARELAGVFDDLDDLDDNDVASNGGGNEDDEEGDVDDDVLDDDEDGLPDERDGMSEEELARLEKSVKPVRLVLTKVSQFKLLFNMINNTHLSNSFEAFPWPSRIPQPSSSLDGMRFFNPSRSSRA